MNTRLLVLLILLIFSSNSHAGELSRDSIYRTSQSLFMPVQGAVDKTQAQKELSTDVLPGFPGGPEGFYKYISSVMEYPSFARACHIEGKVIVGFAVDKEGSLTEIKVLKGIGYGCDEEVVRIMKASPKWTPGIQDGELVRVHYTVPITFQLADR